MQLCGYTAKALPRSKPERHPSGNSAIRILAADAGLTKIQVVCEHRLVTRGLIRDTSFDGIDRHRAGAPTYVSADGSVVLDEAELWRNTVGQLQYLAPVRVTENAHG